MILVPIGGGGLATGVSTLAKLLNPNVTVIGVEPAGAASMKASLEAGHVVTLPTVDTIADGVAVKTPGDKIFPYIQKNIDDIITIHDDELVDAFLDMMEKHKMVVENAGLLPIAALNHLDCKGKNVVPVLSGGNMDVITVATLVQHGLINRGRVFTFSVQLPDRPGELLRVAEIVARENGNIIKLEHNQFVNINRQSGVELRVTLEAFGHAHKAAILKALQSEGYDARVVQHHRPVSVPAAGRRLAAGGRSSQAARGRVRSGRAPAGRGEPPAGPPRGRHAILPHALSYAAPPPGVRPVLFPSVAESVYFWVNK